MSGQRKGANCQISQEVANIEEYLHPLNFALSEDPPLHHCPVIRAGLRSGDLDGMAILCANSVC